MAIPTHCYQFILLLDFGWCDKTLMKSNLKEKKYIDLKFILSFRKKSSQEPIAKT